jgi:homoserine O-acetyltransferase
MSMRHWITSLTLAAGILLTSPLTAKAQSLPPLQYANLGDLKLESGAVIYDCKLGYRTYGKLDANRSNAILFPSWFTGRSGDTLPDVGPGRIIDDSKYYVIAVDSIGNGVSCSPSNSTTQHGIDFPTFTIHDMVESDHRLLLEILHLSHLHAVIGISMGGMQTFEWAVSYPTMMDLLVPIVGTPQQSSYDLLLWNAEKVALESDPGWQGGHYTKRPAMPMVAYLHEMNLSTPQFRVEHTTREQFADYFHRISTENNTGNDPNNYLGQLQAMIGHDIAHGGTLYAAAAKIKAKMLIINARQDHMVNPLIPLGFAKLIHAQTLVLESDCGHMSPGCEMSTISPVVDRFLAQP